MCIYLSFSSSNAIEETGFRVIIVVTSADVSFKVYAGKPTLLNTLITIKYHRSLQ